MLAHGADPNVQLTEDFDELLIEGVSAMSYAAQHEDPWYLREVLTHGGNPNLERGCVVVLVQKRAGGLLSHLSAIVHNGTGKLKSGVGFRVAGLGVAGGEECSLI